MAVVIDVIVIISYILACLFFVGFGMAALDCLQDWIVDKIKKRK